MKESIEKLVEQILEDKSFFIVDVQVGEAGSTRKISVLIDSDHGVSIDDCVRVSRRLGEEIENLNLLDTAYTLEVSSPGVDKPLKLLRQYVKSVGRELSVMLHNSSIKKGVLEAVNEESISLSIEQPDKANKKKKVMVKEQIPFAEIKKSNVIVSFK